MARKVSGDAVHSGVIYATYTCHTNPSSGNSRVTMRVPPCVFAVVVADLVHPGPDLWNF